MKASVWIRGALCVGALIFAAKSAKADVGYGLAGATGAQTLVRFDTANITAVNAPVSLSGLGGTSIVDIDYYPVNGALYGLGANGALFTINPSTGVATTVVTANATLVNATNIDFNPTADRLRVYVGNTSYRLTPDTFDNAGLTAGALTTDGSLSYTPAATSPATPTTDLIGGNAYTNNFNGAASTALFSLDLTTGMLVSNTTGTADAAGSFLRLTAVGSLGIAGFTTTTDNIGFDIGQSGTAFASIGSALYSVNLTTGAATLLGTVPTAGLTTFAIIATAVPEPSTYAMLGLGGMALAFGVMRRRNAGAAA